MDRVDPLFHKLEQAVARDGSRDGLTVGDLYQRLIPYRLVRADLDLFELAQYEHALLRLLAGEGEHLRLGDEGALQEIRKELSSPNLILGIYRDYAGVQVGLGRADLPPLNAAESPPPHRPAPREAACRTCRAPLPAGPDVRFCPGCGADRTMSPCAACGTLLRDEWNFCIRCGARRQR